jgi:D-erythrose 4-phosphate dehydrogenase
MLRIAINGYGRIGRCVLRALYELEYREEALVVAVNDISDFDARVKLTRFDSTQGRFVIPVERNGDNMIVGTDSIRLLSEPDCSRLPWKEIGVDIVLDCTGLLLNRADIKNHLKSGAGKVLISYPGPGDVDLTVVYGINHNLLSSAHHIVSNASCTSNCAIPVLSVIDSEFGIEYGNMTVIHSIMNDQPSMDSYHHNEPRKNRSGVHSIVPVETKLAMGITRVMPQLKNIITASSVRVPTINVSAMDFTIIVKKDTSAAQVVEALTRASEADLSGIMGVETEPLVSVDFSHNQLSCIIDASMTQVEGGRIIKIFAWFDNEWAYAARMLDTAAAMYKL